MTVTFAQVGTLSAVSATSQTVDFPASIAGTDSLLLLLSSGKPSTRDLDAATGFTLVASNDVGGTGATAADTGDVCTFVHSTLWDGTSTNTTLTWSSTASSMCAVAEIRKTSPGAWDVATVNAADSTISDGLSLPAATDPGFTAGDLVVAVVRSATDAGTWANPVFTIPGCTVGAAVFAMNEGSTSGNDGRLGVVYAPITAGTSTGAPTLAIDASGGNGHEQAGGAIFVRLREPAPSNVDATVNAVTATATATAPVPAVASGGTVSGVAAAATAGAMPPTVSAGTGATVLAAAATAVALLLAPTVSAETAVEGGGAATMTAQAVPPSVTASATVTGVVATASAAAVPPTVSAAGGATVAATTATATATAVAPSVSAGGSSTVSTPVAVAQAAAVAPAVTAAATVSPPAATASAQLAAPAVSAVRNATVAATPATATAAACVPTVAAFGDVTTPPGRTLVVKAENRVIRPGRHHSGGVMAFEKRPAEVKDYQVDWSRRLLVDGEDVGDSISTSSWSAETGIVIDVNSSTTTTATAWLSGGTEGVHYTVTNTVTTTQGRTFEQPFVVQVKAAPAG